MPGAVRARPGDRPSDLLRREDPTAVAAGGPRRQFKPVIARRTQANYGVYGVRKMHAALHRAEIDIGRDQTGRLMRELGLPGARRGKPSGPPSLIRRLRGRPTWSSANSPRSGRTSCGCAI